MIINHTITQSQSQSQSQSLAFSRPLSGDFCVASYNFDNVTGDSGLKHFDMNVTHDQRHMIPFIKKANETFLKAQSGHEPHGLKIFASPWSPPGWMKIPIPPKGVQTMDGSAQPQGLQTEYFQSWALYFSNFITAYKRQGSSWISHLSSFISYLSSFFFLD